MRRILLVLFVAGAVCATAFPAAAGQTRLHDARGDMWRSTTAGESTTAPEARIGDITGAVVSHRRRSIVVVVRYVELRRSAPYANYTLRLQNRPRKTREITLEAGPRTPRGVVRVFNSLGHPVRGCPVNHRIDYRRNTIRLVVSRVCLHRPGSVRANLNSYRADDTGTFYADNPHNTSAAMTGWTRWLPVANGRRGPRSRR